MLKKLYVNFEEIISGTALLIMTVCVIGHVIGRLVISKSSAAFDEISYICYAYIIFVGGSSLYKRFGHGAIDLLVKLLPKKVQAILSVFVTSLLVFICGLTFILGTGYCIQAWTRRSQTLHFPYSITAFALVLGFFFMTIQSLFFLKNVIKKKDYYHEIPIYEGIYVVDSVEDQTEAALAHEAEKRLMQNTVSDSEKGGE